jgi:hypothetical protein
MRNFGKWKKIWHFENFDFLIFLPFFDTFLESFFEKATPAVIHLLIR